MGYGAYQARNIFPLSPLQSPLPTLRTLVGAATSLPTHNNHPVLVPASLLFNSHAAILPPSPPLSPTPHASEATLRHADQASTTTNNPPQVSSSIRTTQRDRSIHIDLNVTIVLGRPGTSNITATASRSNCDRSRGSVSSSYTASDQASAHSRASSSSAHNRLIAYSDVQQILSRLESLERLAAQVPSRSRSVLPRSSSFSSGASRLTVNDLRSPVGSTISDLYLPQPIGRLELFFSPPRSPAAIPHSGSLSISIDSRSSSSVKPINTPSSSRSSIHLILSPPATPTALAVGLPGPSTLQRGVQRQPITATTTCYICYDPFQSPVDAVWCRGTCGQNVCVYCFDEWIESRSEHNITCPYWYVYLAIHSCWP
jgi:hypothetical protein